MLGQCGANLGADLDQAWTNVGPSLDQCWANFGPSLGPCGADWGRCGAKCGPILGQSRANSGPVLEPMLGQFDSSNLGKLEGGGTHLSLKVDPGQPPNPIYFKGGSTFKEAANIYFWH